MELTSLDGTCSVPSTCAISRDWQFLYLVYLHLLSSLLLIPMQQSLPFVVMLGKYGFVESILKLFFSFTFSLLIFPLMTVLDLMVRISTLKPSLVRLGTTWFPSPLIFRFEVLMKSLDPSDQHYSFYFNRFLVWLFFNR